MGGDAQVVFYKLQANGLFWFNIVVDFLFFVDTIVQLNISYFDRSQQQTITSRAKIFKRFARKWLIVDVIAFLPYDAIAYNVVMHSSGSGKP
jgi:hypothetical protein